MDFATILGLVLGTAMMMYGILIGSSLKIFWDFPSLILVGGGMISAILVMHPLGAVLSSFKIALFAFITKNEDPNAIIEKITDLTLKARKNGTLSLENEVIENKFLAKGIRYIVDGVDPATIELLMSIDISYMKQRHKAGSNMIKAFGTYAPAFGMIGTLIGLVQMLQNLSDPSTIGPSIAVALITTFYGALFANLIFNPLASKIASKSDDEAFAMKLILDGVLAIVAGDNPKIVQEKLEMYLPPKMRKMEQEMAAKGAGEK